VGPWHSQLCVRYECIAFDSWMCFQEKSSNDAA
jgi:hypothetical protein